MSEGFAKDFVSTSAMAKDLRLPIKNMFQLLAEYGWIARRENKWVLTSKGEYEGGQYRRSEKYGEYIVWPTSIFQHHLLQSATQHIHINATDLGEPWGIPGRLMYRLLAELGWIIKTVKGWELTEVGLAKHGVQLENDDSGELYCAWPVNVREDTSLTSLVSKLTNEAADDMFDDKHSIDGHICSSLGHKRICDWLYLMNISHSIEREIADSGLRSDFYLPQHRLYIEYWGGKSPHDLAEKMSKKAWFDKHDISVIELSEDDLDDLDHVLAKLLLENGVKVY